MSDLTPRRLAEMHRRADAARAGHDPELLAPLPLRSPDLARALDRMLDRIEGKGA